MNYLRSMTHLRSYLAFLCLLPAGGLHAQDLGALPADTGILYNKVGRITFGSDGSVVTQRIAPASEVPGLPVDDGARIFTRVGGTLFRNDGRAYTTVGRTTIASDGITYKRLGNSLFGSDGSAYIELGGVIIGSDGARYHRSGDRLVRTPSQALPD